MPLAKLINNVDLYIYLQLVVSKKLQASYPLTHHYHDDEYINVTRAERDAAMVRIDDTAAGEIGSNASLASTSIPVSCYRIIANLLTFSKY